MEMEKIWKNTCNFYINTITQLITSNISEKTSLNSPHLPISHLGGAMDKTGLTSKAADITPTETSCTIHYIFLLGKILQKLPWERTENCVFQ